MQKVRRSSLQERDEEVFSPLRLQRIRAGVLNLQLMGPNVACQTTVCGLCASLQIQKFGSREVLAALPAAKFPYPFSQHSQIRAKSCPLLSVLLGRDWATPLSPGGWATPSSPCGLDHPLPSMWLGWG